MTDASKRRLMEASGAADVKWEPAKGEASVTGTAAQVEKAGHILQRVATHCMWGASESKIQGLLRPQENCSSARCRLSPMVPSLKECSTRLSAGTPQLTIGSDPSNNLRVTGPLVSRMHAVLEFLPEKGSVYIIDVSTNGTFLNGRRLPPKGSGKVVLWHGDELLLQDPSTGGSEFGYMVNIEIV